MYHFIGRPTTLALGAEQRSNPLPAGIYWVDVFGDNRAKMSAWASTNRSAVQVLSTQTVGDDDTDPSTYDEYTFQVTSPVQWDAVTFGYPEITTAPAAPVSAPGKSASPSAPNKTKTPPAPAKPPLTSNTTVLVVGSLAVLGLVATLAFAHRSGGG